MTKKTYFLQPRNEGQELNYIETYEGDFDGASERAKKLANTLQATLNQGSISVDVLDKSSNVIQSRVPSPAKVSYYKRGWFNERVRHSLARKGIKTGRKAYCPTPYPKPTKKETVWTTEKPIAAKPAIELHFDKYISRLLGTSEQEGEVIVSGGTDPPKKFAFYGGGCGFAHINGKGVKFKKFFEEQNKKLKEKHGYDVFRIYKGYPSGFSVSISLDVLNLIGSRAKKKIETENLPVPPAFKKELMAYAQQDMAIKEAVLRDIHDQIKHKFPNSYIDTRLD